MGQSYLNAASHGLPDQAVQRRMIAHLDLEAKIGVTAAAEEIEDELAGIHDAAAALFHAPKENVGFDSGTLSAWRAYVSELPMAGKRFLVAPHEWRENVIALREMASSAGATIEVLPPLNLDDPDLSAWQARIDDDVCALTLPMVSSVGGLLYPMQAIGALPRPNGMKIVVDAAQALGQIEMNTAVLGCDAIFATTRKWVRAPKQTALFWLADAEKRAAIERFAANETLRLGLGVALAQLHVRGVAETKALLRERATRIRGNANSLGLECLGSSACGSAAVTVLIPANRADRVASALVAADIVVKWVQAEVDEPLSGWQRTDIRPVRIAPHIPTTLSEIDDVFSVIEAAMAERALS